MSLTEYSAKMDAIHLVYNNKALCGRIMLATNYLIQENDTKDEILSMWPRTNCAECLKVVEKSLSKTME